MLAPIGFALRMNSTLPFKEIAGQPLDGEQRAYLEGLFAGLKNRGLSFEDVAPNPVIEKPAPNLEAMNFEERIKCELHPLDAFPLLVEHAAANKPPERENDFRFKWHGLFYLAPNKEGFMCRLRIPGGVVRSFQLKELAKIAMELTSGYVQITTRANLQLRLIEPRNAPEVLSRIQAVGLHSRGAGADNIRNLTCNPTAGIDPHELIDTLPICQQLAQIIINDRSFYDLPRKFNIAFDGGGMVGTLEDTNDIGVKAVKIPELDSPGATTIQPSVYFRIALGGATGHKAFASDLGVLVRRTEILKVLVAIVRVFITHGNRSNRKKARLKHFLETWTLDQYRTEVEKVLGFPLLRAPNAELGIENHASHPDVACTPPIDSRHAHIGAYQQKQKGLNYIGVAIPVGQITPKQMQRIADLAENYGSGEVRLTVWQNLIIPNIPDAFVETIKKALVKAGLHWQTSNLRSGLVACTGSSYCKFASSNTKGHALELAEFLDKRVKLDQPLNIHLTGCPNSCAQHYIGDIGLLGAKVKVSGESVEGYHVFIGGGFGDARAIGRPVFQGISFDQLKPTIEKMLKGYLRRRNADESFRAFTDRHDVNSLQAIFSNDE